MGNGQIADSALNVLVVDDDDAIRKALTACLEAREHHVTAVENAQEAMAASTKRVFDLAFVDLLLGKDSGLDLMTLMLRDSPWMKVVVITAYSSIQTAVEATKRGASDYLPKPFTPAQVLLVTRKAAELRALEQKVAGLQDALGASGPATDLSSTDPAMQRAIVMARQVAVSEVPVLIRGESGTGKNVLAAAIHGWSPRADKPFATVSCPALSAELLESELFGHVKGAFTGAVRDNPGRIPMSEGGTLFLDEIGDLPLRLQPKLLRFLQDRAYERVGDPTTRTADVRVVTATSVNLEKAVAEGRFREDLLYRINMIQLELPPLRMRPDDIVPIAENMLLHFTGRHRRTPMTLSPASKEALRAYGWPGNLRELRNVIERAAVLCREDRVEPEHLFLAPLATRAASARQPAAGDPITIEKLEEYHVRAVLKYAPSLEEAARILGIDDVTLWRRRRKYGI